MLTRSFLLSLLLLAAFLLANPLLAHVQQAADKKDKAGLDFFEKKIRPALIKYCYECHSADSEEAEGGLLLDSRRASRQGGESGPAVAPGDVKKSRLIDAIRYDDDFYQMPPDSKLPNEVIADFVRWIEMGAPDPRESEASATPLKGPLKGLIDFEEARKFWSFQPLEKPPLPQVADSQWCRSPLDRFILARLEQEGVRPAPRADRRTLIRRAAFDLTGLPPTPAEIENFLADDSPLAFAKAVDRLLASPRYGERWGRHWLDVARYADSNGLDENLAYANAFRYRDYVIDSFNADKPYTELIREQLAGDLLAGKAGEAASRKHARLVATGFLSLGPKMLACDDGRKMELDIIDEQVDTFSKAFMGITMGCARCHDHKFDPFSASDYYALAGIFKSTKTMENFKVVARWNEHTLATEQDLAKVKTHQKKIAAAEARLQSRVKQAQEEFLDAQRADIAKYLAAAAPFVNFSGPLAANGRIAIGDSVSVADLAGRGLLLEAESFQRGTLTVDKKKWGKGIGVLLQTGFAEYDLEIPRAGFYQLELRYAAKDSRPVQLSINGKLEKENAAAETTGDWYPRDQRWAVEGVYSLGAGKNVLRLQRGGVVPHIDKILLVKAEPAAESASLQSNRGEKTGKTIGQAAQQQALNEEILRQWVRYLNSKGRAAGSIWTAWKEAEPSSYQALGEKFADAFHRAGAAWRELKKDPANKATKLADAELEPYRAVLYDSNGPLRTPNKPERFYSPLAKKEIDGIRKEKKQLEAAAPKLPLAMGVSDAKPQALKIHIRGNYLTLGAESPRRFPEVFTFEKLKLLDGSSSGRLQLAAWLSDAKHPLTHRVMANRIWLWHFGEGIVRSPDNFGALGLRPTHPELLDWLAARFIESGWSLKQMHREIMLSSTYQMSAAEDPASAEKDPENLLWRKFNRRRLAAEEIRDTILMLGDDLDLTMHGQLLPEKNREYVTGTGSKRANYDYNRRSVYLPILRSAVYKVLQAFDFPDPSVPKGQRAATIVAPQALFMMNDQLVFKQSGSLAAELFAREDINDSQRIGLAYQRVFGRLAKEEEISRDLHFIVRYQAALEADKIEPGQRPLRAWQALCRVLVASNEFIYVD